MNMLSSVVGFYHLVLESNQEQWQWPIMVHGLEGFVTLVLNFKRGGPLCTGLFHVVACGVWGRLGSPLLGNCIKVFYFKTFPTPAVFLWFSRPFSTSFSFRHSLNSLALPCPNPRTIPVSLFLLYINYNLSYFLKHSWPLVHDSRYYNLSTKLYRL